MSDVPISKATAANAAAAADESAEINDNSSPGYDTAPIFTSFDAKGVAERIRKSKRVCLMHGAGISVAAGICDFRSPGGLYDQLKKKKEAGEPIDLPTPESLFTLSYFKQNPAVFWRISNEMGLFPGHFAPTSAHYFPVLLHMLGKLSHCFTQNIDSLELMAGLPAEKITFAHGSFATSSCIGEKHHPWTAGLDDLIARARKGDIPRCAACQALVKPDVVFFGESLPRAFFENARLVSDCDLLIVLGSSLQVYPFAAMAEIDEMPRVLINRDRAGEFTFKGDASAPSDDGSIKDVFLSGDLQTQVQAICQHLGLGRELKEMEARGKKVLAEAVANGKAMEVPVQAPVAAVAAAGEEKVAK